MDWDSLEERRQSTGSRDTASQVVCSRLKNWLSLQDARGSVERISSSDVGNADPSAPACAGALADRLRGARRPLIWLESVDAGTAKAATAVAAAVDGAVIASTGAGGALHRRVMATDGWIGTSFAEAAHSADFILHLGDEHFHELPMLAHRFAEASRTRSAPDSLVQWMLLQDELEDSSSKAGPASGSTGCEQRFQVDRRDWFDLFTRVLLRLRATSTAKADGANDSGNRIEASDEQFSQIAETIAGRLLASHNAVIMWSQSLFSSEADEKLLLRLLDAAKLRTGAARLSLAALEQDPGKVTAAESLMWLTNHPGIVQFKNGSPCSSRLPEPLTSDDIRREFDFILCVRSLPSDQPVRAIAFDAVIDTHSNVGRANSTRSHRTKLDSSHSDEHGSDPLIVEVEAIGIGTGGQLLRADHALNCYVAACPEQTATRPTAVELLSEICSSLQACSGAPAIEAAGAEGSR